MSRDAMTAQRLPSMPKWRAQISALTTGTGYLRRPGKGASPVELIHQVLGQCDVTGQVGMLGIVKEPAVDDAVPAPGLEHFRPVDQHHRTMPRGDVAIGLPKRLRAAQGHAIALTGSDVMIPGFVPEPDLLEEPGQTVVGLCKLRMALHQLAVDLPGHRPGSFASSARACATSLAKASRSARGVSGGSTDRLGSKPASLQGGMT